MIKSYVLDTNILLQSPNSIYGFGDNFVHITTVTLQELDGLKNAPGETGYMAREAIRLISSIYEGNPDAAHSETLLPNGGYFSVLKEEREQNYLLPGYSSEKPDNRILNTYLHLQKQSASETILITNDISLRINAILHEANTQGYKNEQITEADNKYLGYEEIDVEYDVIEALYKNGKVSYPLSFPEQTYLLLRCGTSTALGVYRKETVFLVDNKNHTPMSVCPKNKVQSFALHALTAPAEEIPLVILKGPAGCAKTFLSMAAGLDATLEGNYQKVMITRNNVLSDADIGFLPGTLEEKMNPLIAPFIDNLEVLIRKDTKEDRSQVQLQIEDYLETNTIEVCSMAYMRGRSIPNSYLIIDEAQNATVGQILEVVTRAGEGTKIVICGDPEQIDNPKLDKTNNGLVFAYERMRNYEGCAELTFTNKECVRSPLALAASVLLANKK